MMSQRVDDVLLNISQEYAQKIINAFSLDDLRKGIYEVVSISILRNNIYTDIFRSNKSLENSLNKNLYINKNRLVFEIDRLVEENIAKHRIKEKKELSDKIIKLARAALAEFLIYIMKQTVASKNMLAEAEGLLDRFTIAGTDIVRFHVHGTEYQVQLTPYRTKELAPELSLKNKMLRQFKFRLEKIQRSINNFVNSSSTDGLNNFFKAKIEKIIAPVLQKTTNLIADITADYSSLDENSLANLNNKIENLESEAISIENTLNKIQPTDLETIANLAIDLDNPEEILKAFDGTAAGEKLSEIIKENIDKLKQSKAAERLAGRDFFSDLKDKIEIESLLKNKNPFETEEHMLSQKEHELSFKNPGSKILDNPDIRIYTQEKAKKTAKQNWFTGWLSDRKKNQSAHINVKLGIPQPEELVTLLKKKEEENTKPQYTNTII